MNIKTTLILLIALIGAGIAFYFVQDKPAADTKPVVHTLLDIKPSDITRFVITTSDGKTIAAQKTTEGSAPAIWKLTQPVNATADSFKISSLLESLTGLKSTAQVPATGADAPKTGLDKPQFTVELYEGTKPTKLAIGDLLTVAGGVYVKIDGHDSVDVVSNSLIDSLDKPANDLRKTQLFETASPSVQQLTITHKDGSQLVLEKQAKGWTMIKPVAMSADTTSVEDLVSAVVNMTPVEFVDEPSLTMGLTKPAATVTFSTAAPSTQPSSAPTTTASVMPGAVTVLFGGYDDLQKKNIFAQLPDGTIVKVAASTLDSLNKKPLELRDKTVLDFDPVTINKLAISMDQPATTQPTTMPAVAKSTLLSRRKKEIAIGPMLPTTMATSNPTSAPVVPPAPPTDWVVGADKPADADDSKVTSLLGQLHPLKAEKYLETPPVKVAKTYTITLTGPTGISTILTVLDPGNDAALVGSYNGLTFELPRTMATALGVEFKK